MTVGVQGLIRAAAVVKGVIALVGLWAVLNLETFSAKDRIAKAALFLIAAGGLVLCVAVAGGYLTIEF